MIRQDEFVTAEIKLYYDLHIPEGTSVPAPLLVTVHGYGAHKKYMMREAKLVAPEGFAIISLEAPNRFWREAGEGVFKPVAGWLTDHRSAESVALHQMFILDVIAKHADEGLVDAGRVYLHGFSQACALNFRFAFTHPESVRGFIGICGGIPSDLGENPAYSPTEADVFYLMSDDDSFYPEDKFRDYEEKLAGYLPNLRSKMYHAGHEITDEMREDIRTFLEEKEKEAA